MNIHDRPDEGPAHCTWDVEVLESVGLGSETVAKLAVHGLPEVIRISEAPSHRATQWPPSEYALEAFLLRVMKHGEGDKAGSAWSPFPYEDETRHGETAIETSLIVFDCDKGDRLEDIAAKIKACGFAGICPSSDKLGCLT